MFNEPFIRKNFEASFSSNLEEGCLCRLLVRLRRQSGRDFVSAVVVECEREEGIEIAGLNW